MVERQEHRARGTGPREQGEDFLDGRADLAVGVEDRMVGAVVAVAGR